MQERGNKKGRGGIKFNSIGAKQKAITLIAERIKKCAIGVITLCIFLEVISRGP